MFQVGLVKACCSCHSDLCKKNAKVCSDIVPGVSVQARAGLGRGEGISSAAIISCCVIISICSYPLQVFRLKRFVLVCCLSSGATMSDSFNTGEYVQLLEAMRNQHYEHLSSTSPSTLTAQRTAVREGIMFPGGMVPFAHPWPNQTWAGRARFEELEKGPREDEAYEVGSGSAQAVAGEAAAPVPVSSCESGQRLKRFLATNEPPPPPPDPRAASSKRTSSKESPWARSSVQGSSSSGGGGTAAAQDWMSPDAIAAAQLPLEQLPVDDLPRPRKCANPNCWYVVHTDPAFGSWCCTKCWYIQEVCGNKKGKSQNSHEKSECQCVTASALPDSSPAAVLYRPRIASHWVVEGREYLSLRQPWGAG